ncbi:MAG: DNA-binding protein [Clostridia bacterium]|nr:DNA-binding protein [Clostridia bacterium]
MSGRVKANPLTDFPEVSAVAKNWDVPRLLDAYGPLLTEKQRQITAHYYDEDLSLAEIAENEGVTRQAVRDVIHRTEEQLIFFEEKLGLLARMREEAEARERLLQAALNGESDLAARVVAYCRKEEEHGV